MGGENAQLFDLFHSELPFIAELEGNAKKREASFVVHNSNFVWIPFVCSTLFRDVENQVALVKEEEQILLRSKLLETIFLLFS